MVPFEREIFVVEDDVSVRQSLSFLLTSAGYLVICFADGEALTATARTRCPACILLDINLPGRSGLEILQELSKKRYPAPIIMVTGAGSVEIAVKSLKMGAVDFIEKPFTGSDLILRIEQVTATSAIKAPSPQLLVTGIPGQQFLTGREQEVLQYILQARSDKDISAVLGISPRTAEVHRAAILKKLHARSTVDLLRFAFTNQMVDAAGVT